MADIRIEYYYNGEPYNPASGVFSDENLEAVNGIILNNLRMSGADKLIRLHTGRLIAHLAKAEKLEQGVSINIDAEDYPEEVALLIYKSAFR